MPQLLPLPLPEPAPPEPVRNQRPRSWAAIHLPALALEALDVAANADTVVAIVAERTPKAPVLALSAGAQRAGIETGMTAATACARVATLQLKIRDAAREARLLERLAAWGGRFTPNVSLEPPDSLLLDIGASLKLFGGMDMLQARISSELAAQGHSASLVLAPTPSAALWLARAGVDAAVSDVDQLPAVLGGLPLSTLALPERSMRRFNRLGVKTLRQAFRLPRDGLARRFGPELLREWDRALGQAPEPKRRWQAAARFVSERDLPDACDNLGQLQPLIDDLITALVAMLLQHNAGIDTFALLFRHDNRRPSRLKLRLLGATRDPARIRRLLHMRLERFVLPAPASTIRLVSSIFKTLAPDTPALPGLQAAPAPVSDTLVETLCARLGSRAVIGLAPVDDHRPEQAWRKVVPGKSPVTADDAVTMPFAPRPFWLRMAPQPLQEHDGQPLYRGRALHLQDPPERIEAGWWEADDIRRDYYQARAGDGAQLWVYRERRQPWGWYLHGYFA